MIPVALGRVASIVGGRLQGDAAAIVTDVVVDSRQVAPGALFVALRGEHVDGAAFVEDAAARGAAGALTVVDGPGDRIIVSDPLAALLVLGGVVRKESGVTVVAITGSNGKTLTKDLTAAAIDTQRTVVASRASFNNEIGVPLTLCAIASDTEVVVAEVGSRGPGHIAMLGGALAPDVAVVLNIGEAHAGLFGDLETTALAKAELIEALRPGGTAILNADDPRTRRMADHAENALLYGTSPEATIRLESVRLDPHARAEIQVVHPAGKLKLSLPLSGEHLASNALAAIAVAHVLGLDLERAAHGISTAPTSPGRTRLIEASGRLVLDDSYNANPNSMRTALKTLAHLGASRPTWAVLGEMAELGPASREAHDALGRLATRLGITHMLVVGVAAAPIARAAMLEGMAHADVHRVDTPEDAARILLNHAELDAAILVKASRAAGLERVVDELLAESQVRG